MQNDAKFNLQRFAMLLNDRQRSVFSDQIYTSIVNRQSVKVQWSEVNQSMLNARRESKELA